MIEIPLDAFLDNKLTGFYRAVVIDNEDPEKLGRVKVDHPVYEGVPVDKRPWVLRILPASPESRGQFAIPRVGDEVVIIFLDGSIYNPAYIGHLTSQAFGHDSNEYPDDHGWVDSYGNRWHVKPKNAEEATFTHQSGAILKFQKDGTILLKPGSSNLVKVDGKLLVTDDATFQKNIAVSQNASIGQNASVGQNLSVGSNANISGKMSATSCCCNGQIPVTSGTCS